MKNIAAQRTGFKEFSDKTLEFKKLQVFKMYSKHSGKDKENNVLHEILFEDVNGLQLLEMKNDVIVGKEFFYKPSYFDGSHCSITEDYILCSARIKVGVNRESADLEKKNFLFIWKKKKMREDLHHGFTYHNIELSNKMGAKRAFIVEDSKNNCISLIKKNNIVEKVCLNIQNIKMKFTKEAKGKEIKEIHFKIIGNQFYLNKTSKATSYLQGKEFLFQSDPPKSHMWLVILLGSIFILAISLCILYGKL